MRISDWSSDVCSSDLPARQITIAQATLPRDERLFHSVNEDLFRRGGQLQRIAVPDHDIRPPARLQASKLGSKPHDLGGRAGNCGERLSPVQPVRAGHLRSEEHTSELQSLMRISYAFFCFKKKKH